MDEEDDGQALYAVGMEVGFSSLADLEKVLDEAQLDDATEEYIRNCFNNHIPLTITAVNNFADQWEYTFRSPFGETFVLFEHEIVPYTKPVIASVKDIEDLYG